MLSHSQNEFASKSSLSRFLLPSNQPVAVSDFLSPSLLPLSTCLCLFSSLSLQSHLASFPTLSLCFIVCLRSSTILVILFIISLGFFWNSR